MSLSRLARWCERYSPLVGFAGQGEPADLLLDITGIGPLFGGEDQLAEQLAAELTAQGHAPRIAIAGTIGAAWGTAHFGKIKDEGGRMNDEWKTPGPPFILHHSSFIIPALACLPVVALRLPPETIELLHQLGIVRLEELLRLPRESLASRFGNGTSKRCPLLERLDQMSGAAEEVLKPFRPPPEFQAEWVLEHPVEQQRAVERILERLTERVGCLLAPRRQGAVRLECRLDCAGSEPLRLEVSLFRPSAEPRYLLDLLRLQLEQRTCPGPVGRVGLQVTLAAPLADRQQELFPDAAGQAERHLALLIDRLSGRLGREAVLRPQLLPDAQPERAWRYLPLAGLRQRKGKSRLSGRTDLRGTASFNRDPEEADAVSSSISYAQSSASDGEREPPGHALPAGGRRSGSRQTAALPAATSSGSRLNKAFPPRPLQIFMSPLPLEDAVSTSAGAPARFTFLRRPLRVTRHWGPERIETGWWRGRSVRRDYYRVETEDGRHFWLFCRLDDGRWFLHGSFS